MIGHIITNRTRQPCGCLIIQELTVTGAAQADPLILNAKITAIKIVPCKAHAQEKK